MTARDEIIERKLNRYYGVRMSGSTVIAAEQALADHIIEIEAAGHDVPDALRSAMLALSMVRRLDMRL